MLGKNKKGTLLQLIVYYVPREAHLSSLYVEGFSPRSNNFDTWAREVHIIVEKRFPYNKKACELLIDASRPFICFGAYYMGHP